MTDSIFQMLESLRAEDARCVDEWFHPEQQEALLQGITGTAPRRASDQRQAPNPRRSRRLAQIRRRRLLIPAAGAVAAAATAIVVWGSVVYTAPAQAAVRFRAIANGEIVVTVTNPFVAKKELDAAFAAHGLQIIVNLVPASPSLVGTVIYSSDSGDQIHSLQGGSCVTGGGACPIGLRIPRGFKGKGYITLGRPAKASEAYDSTASAFAPGEDLHCSGLYGAKVSAAMSTMKARGLAVAEWRVANKIVSHAPSADYVSQIDPMTRNTVRVWTEPAPPSDTAASIAYNSGCGAKG